MKIRDIIAGDKTTLSFEVFPPKKDTDFANVEEAAMGIARLAPSYMSVTYGAGGSTKGHTIKLANEIQSKYGVPTIAHLTCVCADKESIKKALDEIFGDDFIEIDVKKEITKKTLWLDGTEDANSIKLNAEQPIVEVKEQKKLYQQNLKLYQKSLI